MERKNSGLRDRKSQWFAIGAALTTLFTATLCTAGQLDSVVPGRWHEFPNSRMDSVAAAPGAGAIIVAWGTGVYDTERERLVIWGGGHNDYDGNEVYAFGPLTSDTPRWTRLTEPSRPPARNVARGADGRPVSRHTYNLLTYLPAPLNKMMSCAIGSRHNDGSAAPGVDFYDFTIDGRAGQPWSAGPTAPFNGFPGGFCIFNPVTQSVWYQPTGTSTPRLQEYRLATNSWTSFPVDVSEDRDPTPAIDTRRNLMVTVGRPLGSTTNYALLLYDLSRPGDRPIKITSTGPKAIENARFPGFIYDAANDQFVGWSGGAAIYTLKAPADPKTGTWVWSQLQLDSGNTVTPTRVAGVKQSGNEIGTFGRFRYVPSQQGVIVVNAGDESVYFFKLPGASAARLPSVTITADPKDVSVSGTSTLTWRTTNASSCTASGAWSGAKATAGTEARGPINTTSSFVLTCDNGTGGTSSGSVTVSTAQAIPAPTVDLNANPPSLPSAGPVTLAWTSNSARSCEAGGGWSGAKPVSGSQNIASVTQQTSFVLTCSGQGGMGSDIAIVTFDATTPPTPPQSPGAQPTLTLSADARSVAPGANLRLTWTSTNTTSCVASNAWTGTKPRSGSETVVSPGQNATYVLTCSGSSGTTAQSNVSVTVSSAAPSPSPAESPAAPARRGGGGSLDFITLALLSLAALWRYRARVRVALLTLSALLAGATAQARDVTTIALQSQSSAVQNEVPFTFGQVFKVGEVPAQMGLKARLSDGSAVPLQVDAKATHADGSLRHAILSGKLSTLAGNGSPLLTLSTGPMTGGAPVALSEVLASSYDTSVSLSLGGTLYTATARQALSGGNVKTWLSGPLVSEWLATMPVRTASGASHPHLIAYFHVRAYAGSKQVRTDVVIENNWAFVPNPNSFAYTVTVSVPDKPAYTKSLTHYSATRWHKRFWWGSEPRVYAKLDKTYLQDTKAIPKYENLQPTENFLNSVRRSTEPMSNGDQTANMDNTGYQPGIGPLPQWDATYAVSTDVRAFDYMLANADGGTAYSIHIRDEKTGLPISIDNYPITSLADEKAVPSLPRRGLSIYSEGSWSSHQPSIGYLPYVVTGDYFYLEEAHFWSAYNLIWPNTGDRNGNQGWWYNGSLRGQAWAYRSLAQSAYITPDNHPYKAYLVEKLRNNIQRDIALYVSPGGPHKNNLGAMFSYDGNEQYLFFDYFMSWASQYLVDLGFNEAIPFRDYKMKFPVGIMGSGADQYCFQAAAQFKWKAGPPGFNAFYPDFKTMFANTVPGANAAQCGTSAMTTFLSRFENGLRGVNAMIGLQSTATHYFANLQPALAAAYDSGVAGGRTAWERAQASGVHPDYRDNPIFALMPRALGTNAVNVSISANPPTVQRGGGSSLSWTSSNAEACLASGDWAGSKATSGSETITDVQSSRSYVLTCSSNAAGSQAGTAIITLLAPGSGGRPTVTLSSSSSVEPGRMTTLTWSSSNASSCSASGGWSGGKSLNGSESVGPLSNSTSFSLSCTGAGGTQVASMTVAVVAAGGGDTQPVPKKKGGGGAMDLATLLMLLGAAAARYVVARVRIPQG
jgi:hypothetical protein